ACSALFPYRRSSDLNLLKNAMKFTPKGGALTVRTRNAETVTDGDLTGQALLVEVADTGIGIAPETISRIFDAFEQGDASGWSRRSEEHTSELQSREK